MPAPSRARGVPSSREPEPSTAFGAARRGTGPTTRPDAGCILDSEYDYDPVWAKFQKLRSYQPLCTEQLAAAEALQFRTCAASGLQ